MGVTYKFIKILRIGMVSQIQQDTSLFIGNNIIQ